MAVISTKFPTSHDAYKIMPLRHNWDSPYRFSIEFKTDIIRSYNGKEQRRAVRNLARHYLEIAALMFGEERLQWEYLTKNGGNKPVFVPLEMLGLRLREFLAPEEQGFRFWVGDTGEPPFWANVSDIVVLTAAQERGLRETRTIASVGNDRLGFEEKSLAEFGHNSQAAPAFLAYLEDTNSSARLTTTVGTIPLRFAFLAQSLKAIPTYGDPQYLGALELFHFKPEWGGGLGVDFQQERSSIDYGFGVFTRYTAIEYPTRIFRVSYQAKKVLEAYEIMNFFRRHKGMAREFFMPTWCDDVPFSSIAAGGLNVLTEGTAFGYAYKDSTVYRRIMIKFNDGDTVFRKVEYVRPLEDTHASVVRVTDPLPIEKMTKENVAFISWVPVCRFATDRLDVDFMTNTVAQMTIPIQTLENFEL